MRTNFDYSKLRGKIKEVCGTQEVFADRIGLGRVSISQRLNNFSEFSQMEIMRSLDILNLEPIDIPSYFLPKKFRNLNGDNGRAMGA